MNTTKWYYTFHSLGNRTDMKIHSAAWKILAAALALFFIFAGDEELTHS